MHRNESLRRKYLLTLFWIFLEWPVFEMIMRAEVCSVFNSCVFLLAMKILLQIYRNGLAGFWFLDAGFCLLLALSGETKSQFFGVVVSAYVLNSRGCYWLLSV